jgi:DnaK suppressor protein
MSPEFRTKILERLHQEILSLRQADARSEGERAPVEPDQTSVGRLSRMDALQQQAMAAAQARRRSARTRALEAALSRIETDDFGWCEARGEPIPEGRLDIDPCASRCVACADGRA